jgi:hypothetical protein
VNGAELAVVTAKSYALYFKDAGFESAVREVFGRPLRIKVTVGDAAGSAGAAIQLAPFRRRGPGHQPRAGPPRSPPLPGSVRRGNPQSSQSQGVVT